MPLTEIIRPNGQGAYNQHSIGIGPSKWQIVSDQSNATGNTTTNNTFYDTYTLQNLSASPLAVVASVVVTIRWFLNNTVSGNFRLRFGGVDVDSGTGIIATASAPQVVAEFSWDITSLRPGGGVWTIGDLDNLEVGYRGATTTPGQEPDFLEVWVTVISEPVPVNQGSVRRALSARVLRNRVSRKRIVVPSAPEQLGVDLVTDLLFADRRGETPAGAGWGRPLVQRRLARLVAYEEDLSPTADVFVTLEAEDLRYQLVHMVDGGVSSENPSSLLDGVMMLDAGTAITRTFTRASRCLVPSPVDRRITAVPDGVEAIGFRGRAAEAAVQQKVLDSVFRNGFGAWTPTAGATIATDETVFSPEVTTKHARLLGTNEGITQTGVPATATWQWLSVDHREVNVGDITQVRVRRASDGLYWDPTVPGWNAGGAYVDLPASQTWIRSNMGPIDQTAGATTFVIAVRTKGNDDCRIYCVQLEPAVAGKGWASSRIDSQSALVTRAASLLLQSADVWPNAKGSYMVRATPNWNSADVVGANLFYLVHVVYNVNNGYSLYYDATANPGKFVFVRRASGFDFPVQVVRALTAGADVAVGVTWQGSDGDNGDANSTIKLVVDGVEAKATSGSPTRVGGTNLARGSTLSTTSHWNGFMARERIAPFVYTREEIVKLMS